MNELSENTGQVRRLTFKKVERLCSKKAIEKLFSEGKSFIFYPLKFIYISSSVPQKSTVQVAFTVGKKSFKKAVHRNAIKRKIREAYRLNKHVLYDALNDEYLSVFIIFIGKGIPGFKQVEDAVKKGIERLINDARFKNL